MKEPMKGKNMNSNNTTQTAQACQFTWCDHHDEWETIDGAEYRTHEIGDAEKNDVWAALHETRALTGTSVSALTIHVAIERELTVDEARALGRRLLNIAGKVEAAQ